MEAAVIGSGPDERVHHARDFGSHSDVSFSFTVCAAWISCAYSKSSNLAPETVFTPGGHSFNAGGHPKDGTEGRALPRFESRERPRNCPDCSVARSNPAELQELPVMRKSSQVSSFSEDGQGRDRTDPCRMRRQPLIVLVAGKEDCLPFLRWWLAIGTG